MAKRTIGVKELKNKTTQVLRAVRTRGDHYTITVGGKPSARLIPFQLRPGSEESRLAALACLDEIDALASKIDKSWKDSAGAADLVSKLRR